MQIIDLLTAPWAIQPDKLLEIQSIYASHLAGDRIDIDALEARIGRHLQNTRQVTMRGETALIPVTGPVFRYANLLTEISGATSLSVLASDFIAAAENPAVRQIVLVIDSPGGQANGIAEFAQLIRSADKPVTAYIDNVAASAAYWIASAADQIVMAKTAMVGSIGAVISIDQRKTDGSVEIISSQSPNKRVDVTTDAGRAQIQTLIDGLAQVFVEDVATYRGTSVETVLEKFGAGGMKLALDAVGIGMADRVGTLETLLAEISGQTTPTNGAFMTQPIITAATTAALTAATIAALTESSLLADNPTLHAQIITVGAERERARIASVEAQALPGHESLIASLKADGKSTGADAAMQVLAAEKAKLASIAERLHAEAPPIIPHAPAPSGNQGTPPDSSLPIETQCQQRWDADAALRGEFQSLETYIAFERAQAAGHAKIFRK